MIQEREGYRFYYNSLGGLSWVTEIETRITVYVPNSDQYTLDNPLTAAFLATNPDLADKPEWAEVEEQA